MKVICGIGAPILAGVEYAAITLVLFALLVECDAMEWLIIHLKSIVNLDGWGWWTFVALCALTTIHLMAVWNYRKCRNYWS